MWPNKGSASLRDKYSASMVMCVLSCVYMLCMVMESCLKSVHIVLFCT